MAPSNITPQRKKFIFKIGEPVRGGQKERLGVDKNRVFFSDAQMKKFRREAPPKDRAAHSSAAKHNSCKRRANPKARRVACGSQNRVPIGGESHEAMI